MLIKQVVGPVEEAEVLRILSLFRFHLLQLGSKPIKPSSSAAGCLVVNRLLPSLCLRLLRPPDSCWGRPGAEARPPGKRTAAVSMDIQTERRRLLDAEGGDEDPTGLMSEQEAYLRSAGFLLITLWCSRNINITNRPHLLLLTLNKHQNLRYELHRSLCWILFKTRPLKHAGYLFNPEDQGWERPL